MWSRVSNLFSRNRSSDSTQVETESLPSVKDIGSEPTTGQLQKKDGTRDTSFGVAPTKDLESSFASDVSADVTSGNVSLGTDSSTNETDDWAAAARKRPLVYAHKLRLESSDSLTKSDPQSAVSAGEQTFSAPAEIRSSEPQALVGEETGELLPPTSSARANKKESETEPEGEPATSSSVLSNRDAESSREPGQRFAMLRAVAEQWRPQIVHCRYLVVVGSTSEARKLAPVIRILRAQNDSVEEVMVCLAGDRTERTREALDLLRIDSDMELNMPEQEITLDERRSRMITGFGKILIETRPEWVVVQGDSTTAAMASMAAYYAKIPVARVDGGGHWHDPEVSDESDPEVLHHRISSLFASIHFAETALGKELLVREGVPEQYIVVTGNPGVDSMHETCATLGLPLGSAKARSSGVVRVLIVIEMTETIAHGLPDLCRAIRTLATSVPGLYQFVWPVVAGTDGTELVNDSLDRVPGILLSGPANYEQYLRLLSECDFVLTDIEDVQEEAPSLGKPVLLMRHATDRPEALRAGITTLTGADAASIQASIRTLARKLSVRHGSITNPYGDGKAAMRILDYFDGRQVLEFGRTALPKLLRTDGPPDRRLLAQTSR